MSLHVKTIVAVIFWLIVWQLLSWLIGNPILFCGPIESAEALISGVVQLGFWETILRTLLQIIIGFLIAAVLGLLLGVLAGRLPVTEQLLSPLMSVIKSTPVVCIIALFLVWVGSSITTSIVVGLVVICPYYYAVLEASHAASEEISEMLNVFNVKRMRRICFIDWLTASPFIMAATKNAAGMAWKAGVAAELIGLPFGTIGEQIYLSKLSLDTASIISWTAVVIFLGWITEKAVVGIVDTLAKAPFKRLEKKYKEAPSANLQTSTAERMPSPASAIIDEGCKDFGEQRLYDCLQIDVNAGDRICIMAPSGSGKTTLLRTISGAVHLDSGILSIAPADASISMVFQEPCLIEEFSAGANLALISADEEELSSAKSILEKLIADPSTYENKLASQLSGGMRKRVEIARALAHPSSILLLDEPFNGLDDETRYNTAKIINENIYGRTLIVATHNAEDASLLNAKIIHL